MQIREKMDMVPKLCEDDVEEHLGKLPEELFGRLFPCALAPFPSARNKGLWTANQASKALLFSNTGMFRAKSRTSQIAMSWIDVVDPALRCRKFAAPTCRYQRAGVEFGVKRNGKVLIADEPGLGKTVQACHLFHLSCTPTCACISHAHSWHWPLESEACVFAGDCNSSRFRRGLATAGGVPLVSALCMAAAVA